VNAVTVAAPGKINWTLEIVRRLEDGYHELRSVMQTIDLIDVVSVTRAAGARVAYAGHVGTLPGLAAGNDLAHRAIEAFKQHAMPEGGASVTIEKAIPIAAGLGGGSSDAAAVLRALDLLYETGMAAERLREIAATVGSDAPFFIECGTASISGRGDEVAHLPDVYAAPLLLCVPHAGEREQKTASMFAAVTPRDYTEGYATIGVADAANAGRPVTDELLVNVFECVTPRLQPGTHLAMQALRAQGASPHLCGAGPSFFVLLHDPRVAPSLIERVRELDFEPRIVQTLRREDALAFEGT
jgi:4-diphosphocytidyl-2-C-methyl-D-erythritol kinase